METKGFLLIGNHHKCLSQLFLLHLNTYVMGLRPLYIFYYVSARIDFRRQNLWISHQILTSKVSPRAEMVNVMLGQRRRRWTNIKAALVQQSAC